MSKRSAEYDGEPDLKRQRERGDYQHLIKVVRYVFTNNLLRKHIMKMVSEIHCITDKRTITGKELDYCASLVYLARFGATTWCAKEYLGMVELSSSLNHSLLKPHITMIRESVEREYMTFTQKDLFNKLVDPTYTTSSAVKVETNENEELYDQSIKRRSEDYLIAMSRPHDQLDELVSILYAANYENFRKLYRYSYVNEENIPFLFKDRIGDKLWEEEVVKIFKTHGKHLGEHFSEIITKVATFCVAPKLAHIGIKGKRDNGNFCDAIRSRRWDYCQQGRYVSLLKYCTPGNHIYNPLREMVLEKCFRVKRWSHRNHDAKKKLPYHYFEHASVDGIIELFRLTYVRGADLVITATVLPSLKNALIKGNLDIVNFIIDYINNDYAHIKMTNDNAQNDIKEEERARERRRLRDIYNAQNSNSSDKKKEEDSPPTHIDEVNEKVLSIDLIDRLLECEALSNMFKCTFKKVLECAVINGNSQVAIHLISIAHAYEFQFDYQRVFELCFESRNDTSRIVSLMIEMNLAHPNDVPEEIHQNISKELAMALAYSKPKPPLNADIVQVCISHGEDVMEVLCTNRHIRDDIEFVNDRNMITETFGISFKMFSMFRVAAPVLARMEHKDDLEVIHQCLELSMERGDQECIDHIIENHQDILTDETIHECMSYLFVGASIDIITKCVAKFGKFKVNQDVIIRTANNNEDVMMYILSWEPSPENIHTAIKTSMKLSKYNLVIRIIDTYGNQYPDKVSSVLGYAESLSQVYDPKLIEYIFTSPNSPYINGYYTSTFTTRIIKKLFIIALNLTNYKIIKVLDKIYSNRLTTQLISNSNPEKISIAKKINESMHIDTESKPSRMDQVFHQVFRDSKLAINIMEQITVIHESLGFNFIKLLENGERFSDDKKEYNVTKGRIVYNNKSLITFIKFGCTQWFIEEYEKLCSFEMYPYNELFLETAIKYKNITIVDKLLSNSNMYLNNFNGMWTNSMLELGYHDGLIQEFKMTIPIKHQSLINALSSGSLKLIKYLVDNKMVLSEEESKMNDEDDNNNDNDFGRRRYRLHNDEYNESKWILKPSMYDMVLLIKQHGVCTGIVRSTLLEFAYIHQVPQSLFELLYQDVKPTNYIIEYILDNYHPDKMKNLIKNINIQGNDKDEINRDPYGCESERDYSNQPISQDNFKRLLMKAVDNGPSEVIDWAMSKCSSNLQSHDWVQLFKLALKNGNHELLQLAYTKCGQIRQSDLFNHHYDSFSHINIHLNMLKQEVFMKIGMSICNSHIINSALGNDREDIIQEALNNPDHLNKSCECYKDSSRCNTSMLLNTIRRGRRDVVDWVQDYHKQSKYRHCSCSNMAFEESLKKGDLYMAKLFVDYLCHDFNTYHGCGGSSDYNYISGSAKNLGRMELSDLGKVTIGQLIEATTFKDTSITEDLIISVLESGVKIAISRYKCLYLTNDMNSAYKLGMMKLVRCLLKNENKGEFHPFQVTRGYPPNVNNHEAIEYFIQSLINHREKNILFERLFKLFDLTLKKYGLIGENKYGGQEKSPRGCPTHHLESLRTDQLNDYKKCISILHLLNENNQTVEITKRDFDILVKDHFELIPLLLHEDVLWTSCLQPSKSIMVKASFDEMVSQFSIEGMKFFWTYIEEIKTSSSTLHKQIGIFDLFVNDDILDNAVIHNQFEFLNVIFNHPYSPLYHKQSFDKNNNNNNVSTAKKYLNVNGMKYIKREAFKYGHIHIINMCNNIINYFNRDIKKINIIYVYRLQNNNINE